MDQNKQPYLRVQGVCHSFSDSFTAIDDITITINSGAFVALVGASGVGKSTLLRIVGGLIKPTEGSVSLNGFPPHEIQEPIGIVFQKDNLMPWRTVHDNIILPLELRGLPKAESQQRVDEMTQLVGLAGFESSYPAQLSGGMAQRVAIARALIHKPALLLLDEPFGALDALTRERMAQELLRIWHALPVTVLLVTHSINEALFLADEVFVMSGRPGTITIRIPVDLPRPRLPKIQTTTKFQQLSAAVHNAIADDL